MLERAAELIGHLRGLSTKRLARLRPVSCRRPRPMRDVPSAFSGQVLTLRHRQFPIAPGRNRITVLAEHWVAAAVAHDPPDLFALQFAVDAGQ
jgi:hypothetical protein